MGGASRVLEPLYCRATVTLLPAAGRPAPFSAAASWVSPCLVFGHAVRPAVHSVAYGVSAQLCLHAQAQLCAELLHMPCT